MAATKAPEKATPLLDRLAELDEKLAEARAEAHERLKERDEHHAALEGLRRLDRSVPDDEEAAPAELAGVIVLQRATRALERARAAVREHDQERRDFIVENLPALVAERSHDEEAEVEVVYRRISELRDALRPLIDRWLEVRALYSSVGWAGRAPEEPFGELRRVIDGAGRARQGVHAGDDGTLEWSP